jgi:hypothetical protein
MFAYNVLNETTLLHQKPDPTQDVDGINIDFFQFFNTVAQTRTSIVACK